MERPDDLVRVLATRPARRPHLRLVGRKWHWIRRRLLGFGAKSHSLIGRSQGSQPRRAGLGFRGGCCQHSRDVVCFGGEKPGEVTGTGRGVKAQRALMGHRVLDLGSNGAKPAATAHQAVIGLAAAWGRRPDRSPRIPQCAVSAPLHARAPRQHQGLSRRARRDCNPTSRPTALHTGRGHHADQDVGLAMEAVASTGAAAPLGGHPAEIYARFAADHGALDAAR